MAPAYDEGYVRVHRQVMESDLWQEAATVFKAAIAILLMTEWRRAGRDATTGRGTPVHVPRGHVVLSGRGLASAAVIHVRSARQALTRLAAIGFIAPTETSGLYYVPKYDHFNPQAKQIGAKMPRSIGAKMPRSEPGDSVDRGKNAPSIGAKMPHRSGQKCPDRSDVSIYVVKKGNKGKKVGAETSAPAPDKAKDEPVKKLKLTHPPDPKPRVAKRDIDAVVTAYTAAVDDRLGFVPKLGAREYKHARELVLRHGAEHAVELAGAYPRLDNPKLQGKGFPFDWLLSSANEVEVALRGLGPRKKRDPLHRITVKSIVYDALVAFMDENPEK